MGLSALLLAGQMGIINPTWAQETATEPENATQPETEAVAHDGEGDEDVAPTIDRGKVRLQLLIRLVENELQEATIRRSRLTAEASALDQERRRLQEGPSTGSEAERRQIEVIAERLERIDQEVAEVNARLPEINAELAELNARLEEANGVVRQETADTKPNLRGSDSASLWLDGKRKVQEALVYLGGYNALIDGDFGPRSEAAVRVYQERQGLAPTGTLTPEEEEALLSEADVLRARYGMTTIEDPDKGYRVTYPSGLLLSDGPVEPNGWRYASNDDLGELVMTSEEGNSASEFRALYDELIAQYDVQYRRQRNSWFVVAGLVDEGRIIYDTARLAGDRIIRARLSYPADWRDLWSPFAVIMFNSFEPSNSSES